MLAREYSRASLVGKGVEFVYLAASDRTVHWHRGGGEELSGTDHPGRGCTADRPRRRSSGAGGWRRASGGVDQALIEDVVRAGGSVYRTHGAGFMLVRARPAPYLGRVRRLVPRAGRQRRARLEPGAGRPRGSRPAASGAWVDHAPMRAAVPGDRHDRFSQDDLDALAPGLGERARAGATLPALLGAPQSGLDDPNPGRGNVACLGRPVRLFRRAGEGFHPPNLVQHRPYRIAGGLRRRLGRRHLLLSAPARRVASRPSGQRVVLVRAKRHADQLGSGGGARQPRGGYLVAGSARLLDRLPAGGGCVRR